ncbi:MAG TPA: DUF5606 domain-containing protein [Mucilaginibacter sp.]|jgi:hypothetical protein|nr:DUF5606 domain-containing protein [Mucilaginibacter sp.]
MNLKGIVAVGGKPGLWKALAQNKTGFILESVDAQKIKLVANLSTAKIAALDEITIFGDEDDILLTDILKRFEAAKNVPDPKADGKVLREFFREVAPGHDEEKVYASDMKKIVSWYHIMKDQPFFSEPDPTEAPAEEPAKEEAEAASVAETKADPKAKKSAPKKKAAKK